MNSGHRIGAIVSIHYIRELMLAGTTRLLTEDVAIDQSLGRVLGSDVAAERSSPPWDCSAMDGIAVWTSSAVVNAGSRFLTPTVALAGDKDHDLASEPAVRIMTGARVPSHLNTVIPVELLQRDGAQSTSLENVSVGSHIRRAGDDVRAGEVVARQGDVVTPFRLAAMAAAGIESVEMVRRPIVHLVVTGKEVVATRPAPHQIVDVTSVLVANAVSASGGLVGSRVYVGDDFAALRRELRDAHDFADVIVTTGGVGPGETDHVVATAREFGEIAQHQLALKPGKPFAFGYIGTSAICGLPGNPGAAIASFELLVGPLLRRLAGLGDEDRALPAIAAESVKRKRDGRIHALRARAWIALDGRLTVSVLPGQGSHQLHEAADANALALLPDSEGVIAGDSLNVILLAAPGLR